MASLNNFSGLYVQGLSLDTSHLALCDSGKKVVGCGLWMGCFALETHYLSCWGILYISRNQCTLGGTVSPESARPQSFGIKIILVS